MAINLGSSTTLKATTRPIKRSTSSSKMDKQIQVLHFSHSFYSRNILQVPAGSSKEKRR